jgi:beta-fructofuranosidase
MQQVSNDPHRSNYHFLPPANWMNDPNGVIDWNGHYHLFYQYNPNGAFWGTMHWGHAISSDLVHWQHCPIALAPTPGTVDEDGCFSGCAVDHNGVATLIYSGHRGDNQRPCIATSTDPLLLTWQKHAGNPVIPAPPADLDLVGFRDHAVWYEDGNWYHIIGAGIRDVGGAALLYCSPNLIDWNYLHPLWVGDLTQTEPVWSGTMWECPQLLRFEHGAVLLVSVWEAGRTLYSLALVGDYTDQRFVPRSMQKLDYGNNYFYAPQACIDRTGRTIMWGWIQEGRNGEAQRAAGWSGVMSLPRLVTLDSAGTLEIEPVPELRTLRDAATHFPAIALPAESLVNVPIHGTQLELALSIAPDHASEIEVIVRCSPDGSEQTIIRYQRATGTISIDSSQASRDPSVKHDQRSGPLHLKSDNAEPLELRIWIDNSVIEVFANRRACLTGRVYPTRSDSLGVALYARGGSARLVAGTGWHLKSS